MRVRFADATLDTDAMELHRGSERVAVEPQVLEVLAYLVAHRERMVPKTELLDEIWGDRFVSESALSSRIKSARQAIGDNGRDQRLIRTVHGRGFRFVGEVRSDGDRRGPGVGDVDLSALVIGLGDGEGFAVEVVGPPSATRRAVDAVLSAAEPEGVLVGHGGVTGSIRPIASVMAAVDELVTRRPGLLDVVPAPCRTELERVGAGVAPTSPARLLVSVRELLRAAALEGGVVLVVEDVHLIDGLTVDLVRHVARTTRRAPIGLVVTHVAGFTIGDELRTAVVGPAGRRVDDLPESVRRALRRAALMGPSFRLPELAVAAGLEHGEVERVVAVAAAADLIEVDDGRWRFREPELADRLAAEATPEDRAVVERDVTAHRVVAAVRRAAAQHRHDEVVALTDGLDAGASAELLEHRADALAELGDRRAVGAYRLALRAEGDAASDWLRARLARVHLREGDVDTAAEVLDPVDVDASDHPGVRMVGAMVAYFRGDVATSERLLESMRDAALAPGATAEILDVFTMQGMIAHSRGEWFDRLRRELRLTGASADLARTVFDSHVCVSQYLLYGPTGHDEVVRLARELAASAEQLGRAHAVAFASTLEGEAHLLQGDLEAARACLESAVATYRALGAETGLAHALQRLAEVALHEGDRAEAERLVSTALPLARWSPLSAHLVQRLHGTLIAAAPDSDAAARAADDALVTVDDPETCMFCHVMVAVPATIAYAAAGRLDDARAQLDVAQRFAARWPGPAWPAAATEAAAVVARAEGREDDAVALFGRAASGFDLAAQPLDAARCREAV